MKRGAFALLVWVWGLAGCREQQESQRAVGSPQVLRGRAAPGIAAMEEMVRSACGKVGLAAPDEIRIYGRDNLHEYIDGAAARYLGYSFNRAAVAEVSAEGQTYVLAVYHFTRPQDAYGIWSIDAAGEAVEAGQRSAYGGGLLQLWQGSYFGRVHEKRYRLGARNVVVALGQALADRMGTEAELPALLSELPGEGLTANPVFFHEQPVLNYLYYVSDENLLKLGPETDAVFAEYARGEGRAKLLVVRYGNEETATAARDAFVQGYLEMRPDAASPLGQLEDGKWTGISEPRRETVRVVLGASTRRLAEGLLTPPE